MKYPDAHWQQVAEVYVEAIEAGSRRMNLDVAETYGVPVETARRWVKEVRRRGILPSPGQGVGGVRRCSGRCGLHCPGDAP